MVDFEHIKLQFQRLTRHTEQAKKGFDQITYLDLAHSLRIWTDMKTDVDKLLNSLSEPPSFKSFSPDKHIKSALRGSKYFAVTGGAQVAGLGRIDGFVYSDKVLSDDEVEMIKKMGPPPARKTNLSFSEWLGSEIIVTNVSLPNQQPRVPISIEKLIKRVANILGASHPKGMEPSENKFDPHIRYLNEIKISDSIPLPYYQLLQNAQIIIETLAPILSK